MFGIDVSKWQGNYDFNRAKQEGVEFVILKIGGREGGTCYKDSKFDENYKKCKDAGLHVGCYYFATARTMEEAKVEANHLLELLRGKQFDMPIFYDVEGSMLTIGKRLLTDIIKYVLSTVERNKYWVGLYGAYDNILYYCYDDELSAYSHWLAKYCKSKPKMPNKCQLQMWQFGGNTNVIRDTKVAGVVVDQNYSYVDYPTLIKANELNGYVKEVSPQKDNTTIAKEVIAGKWGNGLDRKARLEKAGYNYKTIQQLVNKMLQ